MVYSNEELLKLSKDDPAHLSKMLTNVNTNIVNLIFGIECLASESKDAEIFFNTVSPLLKHINSSVRESACISLGIFLKNKIPPQEIIDKIRIMSTHDPSHDVKEAADILLKDISAKNRII